MRKKDLAIEAISEDITPVCLDDPDETPSVEEFFMQKSTPVTLDFPTNKLVIPDVHADIDALNRSLNIGLNFFAKNGVDPEIIFLGDLIDRGEDSYAVISSVVNLIRSRQTVSVLIGNHEAMMIESLVKKDPLIVSQWIWNGGLQTLKSFIDADPALDFDDFFLKLSSSRISGNFHTLLYNLNIYFETFKYIADYILNLSSFKTLLDNFEICIKRSSDLYVHAGFLPNFLLSGFDVDNWVFDVQTQFRDALNAKLRHNQNDFDLFVQASTNRGGKGVAGPLWADIDDFLKMNSLERGMLSSLFINSQISRMVVGHNIVKSPMQINLSSIQNNPANLLFLDTGMSNAYTSQKSSAQCLIQSEDSSEYVLDQNNNLIQL